jgi:hypothetical protein
MVFRNAIIIIFIIINMILLTGCHISDKTVIDNIPEYNETNNSPNSNNLRVIKISYIYANDEPVAMIQSFDSTQNIYYLIKG